MVLARYDFEEVECTGESLDDCGAVYAYSKPSTRQDGFEARCFEVLQDGDQYLSQDTCLQAQVFDDDDSSEALFSSASICKATSSFHGPPVPVNAMAEMLQAEKEGCMYRPSPNYLLQRETSAGDRASVVDNLTRAATQLSLSSDVLFLAVTCLDRCLSLLRVQPEVLDTTALACLWIAAKYEHCVVPPAVHFLAAAQSDFTSARSRQLLVDMEARVLQALDYRVCSYPTTKTFLRTIFTQLQQQLQQKQLKQQQAAACGKTSSTAAAVGGQIDPRLYFCASYLAEMSLLECKLVPFPPSQVAAAAFASANLLIGGALQDSQLVELTGYSLSDIKLPMQWLLSVHHVLYQGRHLPLTSMYETARKYRHAAMCRVGLVPSISRTDDPRLRLCQ